MSFDVKSCCLIDGLSSEGARDSRGLIFLETERCLLSLLCEQCMYFLLGYSFDFGSYSILPTRHLTLFSSHCRTLTRRQKLKV